MRILEVNKFDEPTSGAERYYLQIAARLEDLGHEVARFSTASPGLPVSATFTTERVDFHASAGLAAKLRAARTVWSNSSAGHSMESALREFRPDLVHFHNIAHQLSHSVVDVVHRAGIGTVMTCHDYKLICPAYIPLREGSYCDACSHGLTTKCTTSRCLHDSVTWSGLASLEALKVRRSPLRYLPRHLVAPSRFMATALKESWLKDSDVAVHHIPNPVDSASKGRRSGGYGIYVGRLVEEKGVGFAIQASRQSQIPLVIVGDGPARHSLELSCHDAPVRFVGFRAGAELDDLWDGAVFNVMPSVCAENAPLSALEGLARGIPLVSTAVGGLPELHSAIPNAGVQVPPADAGALAAAFAQALRAVGPSPEHVECAFGWNHHVDRLMAVFDEATT